MIVRMRKSFVQRNREQFVKRKSACRQKFHNNSMQPFLAGRQQVLQTQACFPQPQPFLFPPTGRASYFNSTQQFQRPASRMQAKPTDICLACGQFGHCRRRPFSYSENECGSHDISLQFVEFSNVHNCDRSSNATLSNLAYKIV